MLRIALFFHRLGLFLGQRVCAHLQPRFWSNQELRRIAPLFGGVVANVSGWKDQDKRGDSYRNYFSAASAYYVTNYPGSRGLEDGVPNALELDLEKVPPTDMLARFDVVFSHTVLEHIFATRLALHHLTLLSKDIVIIVVPFLQDEHFEDGSYGDHWRWAPAALKRALNEEGLEILYSSTNDSPFFPIYNFVVASKLPEKWRGRFPVSSSSLGRRVGSALFDARVNWPVAVGKLPRSQRS